MKPVHIFQKFILIVILATLYACSGSGSDDNGTVEEPKAYGESSIVHGIWKSDCFTDDDNVVEYMYFLNGEVDVSTLVYGLNDATCEGRPVSSSRLKGTYSIGALGESSEGYQIYEIDLALTRITETITLKSIVHVNVDKMHLGLWQFGDGERVASLELSNTRVKIGAAKKSPDIQLLDVLYFPTLSPGSNLAIHKERKLAFLAMINSVRENKLKILDISIPSYVKEISTYSAGGIPVVVGDYLYLFDDTGFDIISFSDPTNPIVEKRIDLFSISYPDQVKLQDSYLYILDKTSKFSIINVLDPLNPSVESSYIDPVYSNHLDVEGNYVFIGSWSSSNPSLILDITDKKNPVKYAEIAENNQTSGYLKNEKVYTNEFVYNIHDTSNPVYIGWFYATGNGITHINDYLLYYNSDIQIVDFSIGYFPWRVFYDRVESGGGYSVVTIDNYIYLSRYNARNIEFQVLLLNQ